ncbi:MAG TPA: hypothetical protein PK102_11625, partial [bacterium]|nr:hypothetical protein [bacterium]
IYRYISTETSDDGTVEKSSKKGDGIEATPFFIKELRYLLERFNNGSFVDWVNFWWNFQSILKN